ncbi:MAG: hypothetical protein NT099_02875, partial [Candidatus Saganbacteria bacterium]|nr:hypothetical protein [Candidatus Saganbacteria bacterium]
MKKVLALSLGLIFCLTLAFSAMAVLKKVAPVSVPNITVTYIVRFENSGTPYVSKNFWLVTKN